VRERRAPWVLGFAISLSVELRRVPRKTGAGAGGDQPPKLFLRENGNSVTC
jgi:hypothetical protein